MPHGELQIGNSLFRRTPIMSMNVSVVFACLHLIQHMLTVTEPGHDWHETKEVRQQENT